MFTLKIPVFGALFRTVRREERRSHPRFKAVAKDARILWKDGKPCHIVIAELENISRGGARLVTNRPIKDHVPALLGLSTDGDTTWFEASVVRAVQGSNGRWTVQLQFDRLCPKAVVEHVVNPDASSPDAIAQLSDPAGDDAATSAPSAARKGTPVPSDDDPPLRALF
jgi:hypothetical protein